MVDAMIEIDGSYGEGGGQILRTALALSAITGKSFNIDNIRKNRCDSGLKHQHLYCIKSVKEMTTAETKGDEIGSEKLFFKPNKIIGGNYNIDIETAGSVTLLLQSLIIPAIFANKKTKYTISGGTDVKWSMPVDYLKEILIPVLKQVIDIDLKVLKRGYYPKGSGKIEIKIKPKSIFTDNKLVLTKWHKLVAIKGVSHASKSLMSSNVAERQARSARYHLSRIINHVDIREEYSESKCSGSGIMLWAIFSDNIDEVNPYYPARLGSDSLGAKGKTSEKVGEEASNMMIKELELKAPVDEHLADNLIPFLGIFGGSIKTTTLSEHTKTNIYITEKFLDIKYDVDTKNNLITVKKGFFE